MSATLSRHTAGSWFAAVLLGTVALSGSQGGKSSGAEPAPAKVDSVKEIRPILKSRCFECHGPDRRESGLRLDRKEEAFAGGDSGAAIVPGKPDESLLMELINAEDPDRVMPPTDSALTARQIDLFKRWIAAGASWPDDQDDQRSTSRLDRRPWSAFAPAVEIERTMETGSAP